MKPVTIMGIFAADVNFRTPAMPNWGQTVMGSHFKLGPGGKGSNQSVAAARLGGDVYFISKIGDDTFGKIAQDIYSKSGVNTRFLFLSKEHATGSAAIIVDDATGENAIIVVPDAANELTYGEIDKASEQIGNSSVFMTQLELPHDIVEYGLKLAHTMGVPTILNPAPARPLNDSLLEICDYLTPNESEAEALTGQKIVSIDDAEKAADILLARGVKTVILTLGARGALVKNSAVFQYVPSYQAGPVLDTTGAGDAFNGGLAVALSENLDIISAVQMGCAVAGISVTRHGTAPSMPARAEVDQLLTSGSRSI